MSLFKREYLDFKSNNFNTAEYHLKSHFNFDESLSDPNYNPRIHFLSTFKGDFNDKTEDRVASYKDPDRHRNHWADAEILKYGMQSSEYKDSYLKNSLRQVPVLTNFRRIDTSKLPLPISRGCHPSNENRQENVSVVLGNAHNSSNLTETLDSYHETSDDILNDFYTTLLNKEFVEEMKGFIKEQHVLRPGDYNIICEFNASQKNEDEERNKLALEYENLLESMRKDCLSNSVDKNYINHYYGREYPELFRYAMEQFNPDTIRKRNLFKQDDRTGHCIIAKDCFINKNQTLQ